MGTNIAFWIAALAAVLLIAGDAYARVEGFRLGVAAHNVLDENQKEEGANVNAELVFSSPAILGFLGAPRPVALASINTDGNANLAGFGLVWTIPLKGRWSLEPSLAYVVHDGELANPFPRSDPRWNQFANDHVIYGSRDLFRESIALERELTSNLGAQVYFAHVSHGQVIGEGVNQGAEELGVRLAWRFRDARQ